ncbi:MAG TPA: glycosyltransferase family 4 protein [Nocardioides sp.]|nr:glycosyltransferase family 4 protein [Nocardioides sp.]
MRILHVTDCYLPRLGGIEHHVSSLVAHQRARGHDARVVTTTRAGTDADPDWVRRVDRAAEAFGEDRPDVVHAHLSVVSPFATAVARRAGVPTLATVHSLWTGYGMLPRLATAGLGDVTWSAVSDAAAEPLRQALRREVSVLPNAVDPELWRPLGTVRRPGDPVTVVSVMRMTRTKRTLPLARMLRAARAAVPTEVPLRAVVVGNGPQRPSLERYLARHGMSDWVSLPGRLDARAVRRELARADAFVAPATRESFGIAALEARAQGLPVVASSRSGVTEFVRDGREGLLAADDDEMVDAIARLATEPLLRRRIRTHNTTVPLSHDWDAACTLAEALYLEAGALNETWSVTA